MRNLVISLVLAMILTMALAVPALAVPAHVHTPNHCQDLANGQLNHGVHVAHIEAAVVIPNLCGHP
ncbi:MAG: hypothetical protein HYX93_07325 [Chloroflexi bacterium]|nr:hypothetical protein [Chloroflexota bacterium]